MAIERVQRAVRLWSVTPIGLGLLTACAIGVGGSEVERGALAAEQVEEQIGLVQAPELQRYVEAVGGRLAEASARSEIRYRFHLLDMPEPNAFALPGGFIYVSRGLLAYLNSEDELAAVVGHEIGHVAARHHVKQALADAPLAPLRIATGLGGALASVVAPRIGSTIAATGQLTSALVHAPYSREQESEADRIGQTLAAASGWDPNALSTFMATLGREEALQGGNPNRTAFLSTHPASGRRSRDAEAHAAELTRSERAPIARSRRDFLERLRGTLVGTSAAEGVFDGDDFLHAGLELAWSLPSGESWKLLNQDRFVGAVDRERESAVVLQVAAEGDDPMDAAREATAGRRLERALEATRVGGLAAARGRIRERGVTAELTWIAHRDLIFLINGFAPTQRFEALEASLRRSADSFRVLSPDDRQRIREDRLEIAAARQGETLEDVLERFGSRWSVEEAAVANAMLADERLVAGQPVKITRPVRLEGRQP
jgi:predicted Zn-dependent protease